MYINRNSINALNNIDGNNYDRLVVVVTSRLDALGRQYGYEDAVKDLVRVDVTGMPGAGLIDKNCGDEIL